MITAATVQEYYQQAKRWQNELDFYEVEVHILHQLLDKFIEGIQTSSQVEHLGALLNDLFEWSAADKLIAKALKVQLLNLAGMLNDDAAFADNRCAEQQEILKLQMEDFRCEYQQLKTGIYNMVSLLSPAGNVSVTN